MISKSCYSKEWIKEKRKELPKKNPELIEKVIMALTLLEKLKLSGLDFTFKGGTSLLLLLGGAHRFSIDIDIIIPKKPEDFDEVLKFIISDGIFIRCEEQVRKTNKNIPKGHYKFFYKSVLNESEAPILLDILFEENPYIETKVVPIKSLFINIDGDFTEVSVPSINCILGDKLTAYAPNTTGIPYGGINIVKDNKFSELKSGISKLGDFVYSENFVFVSGVLSAAKAAYLAMLLKSGSSAIGERFHAKLDLSSVKVSLKEFSDFNKIKKISAEAFYYWYRTIDLVREISDMKKQKETQSE